MAEMRRVKKVRRKYFLVGGMLLALVACGAAVGFLMYRNSRAMDDMANLSVKSEKAVMGNISKTVEASGNIEAADTLDVTVPAGIKVKSVLVESGDTVKKGQTLAKLDSNSVISVLADIEESIEAVETLLDEEDLSTLQKGKLEGEKEELESARASMNTFKKKPVLAAGAAGIVGDVNVSEGSEATQSAGSSQSVQSTGSQTAKNMVAVTTQADDVSGEESYGTMGSGSADPGGAGSGNTGSNNTGSNSASSGSTDLYSYSESTAFTIQTQTKVKILLNIDELDILAIKKGQAATITLDAVEDREFKGTVTKVASSAQAGDGNAKYEVYITLKKDADMRIGMTAAAVISVSEAKDVLTVPMNALQQRGEETFVYTAKDDSGNLSGEVTVETGLSDGQNVEIKSGLSEGDTIYYTRMVSEKGDTSNMGKGTMPGSYFGGIQKQNGSDQGGRGERPVPAA